MTFRKHVRFLPHGNNFYSRYSSAGETAFTCGLEKQTMDGVEVVIRSVTDVGPGSVAIEFETPSEFDGVPGQFVEVSARLEDEFIQRYFTLSSADVEDTFEITVGIDPDGTFSPWLANRESGDSVRISGPYGDVYYRGEDRIVVIAAGPGIGPAVGIGERAHLEDAAIAIVHPAGNTVHRERLQSLSEAGASIYWAEGGLEDAVQEAINAVGGTVYVYGFSPFVQDAIAAIEAAGYDPDDARVESFGPGP